MVLIWPSHHRRTCSQSEYEDDTTTEFCIVFVSGPERSRQRETLSSLPVAPRPSAAPAPFCVFQPRTGSSPAGPPPPRPASVQPCNCWVKRLDAYWFNWFKQEWKSTSSAIKALRISLSHSIVNTARAFMYWPI